MMTSRDADRMQTQIYQKMTVEEKLDIALGMWRFGQELNRSGRLLYFMDKEDTDKNRMIFLDE